VGSVSEVAFQASTSREATERSTSNLRSTCEVPPPTWHRLGHPGLRGVVGGEVVRHPLGSERRGSSLPTLHLRSEVP
jgi:hypothetical protein